jgi:adenosylcobinamide-GDP ribazoletransferase
MRSFSLAWQFLTIFPWRVSPGEVRPVLLGRSMGFYPIIGLILGLILWGAFLLSAMVFPRSLTDGLMILLLVLCTGGLHLDGLADSCDGLALGKTAEERLAIMKDHRIGAFGVLGLILVLGIKFLALDALPAPSVGKAWMVVLAVSRWSMVQLTYFMPYARKEGGLGSVFKENIKTGVFTGATVFTLASSVLLLGWQGAVIMAMASLSALGIQLFFGKKIGGFTGDILGAANELNETVGLLVLAAILSVGV